MCANCNVPFQRKLRSGETKWMCRVHNNSKADCPTFPIEEAAFHSAFCRLYYKLKHHGGPIFTQMLSNLQKIRYSRMLWSEDVISLNKKISDILSQVQFLAQLQQAGGVDPDTFIASNNKLSEQLRRLKQEKQGFSTPTATIWQTAPAISWTRWRMGRTSSTGLMRSCSMRL